MAKNRLLFGIGIFLLVLPFISPYLVPEELQAVNTVSRVVFRQCIEGEAYGGYVCLTSCLKKPTISVDTGSGLNSYMLSTIGFRPTNITRLSFQTYNKYNLYKVQGVDRIYLEYIPGTYAEFVKGGDCSTDPIPHFGEKEVYKGGALLSQPTARQTYVNPPVNITAPEPEKTLFERNVIKLFGIEFPAYISLILGIVLILISS